MSLSGRELGDGSRGLDRLAFRGNDDGVEERHHPPKLRAHLGVTRMSLPDATEARNVTGYERYTITPFGATRAWPVIADASLADRDIAL